MDNIQNMNVNELKPYERNPRHNEEAVDKVAASIREFGFRQPIVVDKNNVVIVGHTRLKAAQQLGLDKVPVLVAYDLTEEQANAYRLADNKTAEFSLWDDELLELEMFDINEIDMSEFGFDIESELENDKKKETAKKRFEKMQLKAFEHYDYVVFVFKNTMDWLNVVNEFEIEKVDAGYGKTKKVGVGRVIDGKRLLEKMGYTATDIE